MVEVRIQKRHKFIQEKTPTHNTTQHCTARQNTTQHNSENLDIVCIYKVINRNGWRVSEVRFETVNGTKLNVFFLPIIVRPTNRMEHNTETDTQHESKIISHWIFVIY